MRRKNDDRDGSASTPEETTQPMRDSQSQGSVVSQATDSQSPRSKKMPRRWTSAEKEVMTQWWLARAGSMDTLPLRPDSEAMCDDYVAKGQIGADAFLKSVNTFFVAEHEKHLKLKAEAATDVRAAEKREEAKLKKREEDRKAKASISITSRQLICKGSWRYRLTWRICSVIDMMHAKNKGCRFTLRDSCVWSREASL